MTKTAIGFPTTVDRDTATAWVENYDDHGYKYLDAEKIRKSLVFAIGCAEDRDELALKLDSLHGRLVYAILNEDKKEVWNLLGDMQERISKSLGREEDKSD